MIANMSFAAPIVKKNTASHFNIFTPPSFDVIMWARKGELFSPSPPSLTEPETVDYKKDDAEDEIQNR